MALGSSADPRGGVFSEEWSAGGPGRRRLCFPAVGHVSSSCPILCSRGGWAPKRALIKTLGSSRRKGSSVRRMRQVFRPAGSPHGPLQERAPRGESVAEVSAEGARRRPGVARAQAGGGAGPRGPGPGPGGQGGPGGPGEAIPVSGASPDRRAPVCAPRRGRCQARGHGNTPRPVDGERGRGRGQCWGRQRCQLLPPGLHPVAVSPALIPLTAIQDLRSFCLCQLYCLNYVIKD